MDHAIDAGKRRAAALVTVGVELFLGEDITACLSETHVNHGSNQCSQTVPSHSPTAIKICYLPRTGKTPS